MVKGSVVNVFGFTLLLFVFSLLSVSAFSGVGAGTLANPFNITNCTQLT